MDSPSWPHPRPSMSDMAADVDAFINGCNYGREAIEESFIRFWAEQQDRGGNRAHRLEQFIAKFQNRTAYLNCIKDEVRTPLERAMWELEGEAVEILRSEEGEK